MRSLSVVVSFLLRTGPAFARSLFALERQNVCATMRGRLGHQHNMIGAFAEPLRVNERRIENDSL
jgi:hypothetical protein